MTEGELDYNSMSPRDVLFSAGSRPRQFEIELARTLAIIQIEEMMQQGRCFHGRLFCADCSQP